MFDKKWQRGVVLIGCGLVVIGLIGVGLFIASFFI